MTAMTVATLYAGLFGLLLLGIKIRVGAVRAKTKVAFGGGDNAAMEQAMRVQGNAVEDIPIVVLGLIALGAMAAPIWLVHALGGTFLVARLLHAVGLSGSPGFSIGRAAGTTLSMLTQLATAGTCIYYFFAGTAG